MPPYTTIKTFMDALMTGRTNTTKALDALLQMNLTQYPEWQYLTTPRSLDRQPPNTVPVGWWKNFFKQHVQPQLSQAEEQHIDAWDDGDKEQVRSAMVQAQEPQLQGQPARPVKFFWELHGGEKEDTQIDVPAQGDIAITFRNPRDRLKVSGLTWGDIKVEM